MIPDQFTQQFAEIEALLARSRATTAAVAAQRATRTAQAPYCATRIAPRRVDPPAPPPRPRDRFIDQVAQRRVWNP